MSDELQDMKLMQWKIMGRVAEAEKNLVVGGDDEQSSYGLRGWKREMMLGVQKRYPQEKKPHVPAVSPPSGGQTMTEPAEATFAQEVDHAAQQEKIAKPIRTG